MYVIVLKDEYNPTELRYVSKGARTFDCTQVVTNRLMARKFRTKKAAKNYLDKYYSEDLYSFDPEIQKNPTKELHHD